MIVAAKPDESVLFKVISGAAEPAMPPKDEPQLNAEQIALVREWISQGAKGESNSSRLMNLSNVPKLASDPTAKQRTSSATSAGEGLIRHRPIPRG